MITGISIHIGLNHVDPAAYDGWDGELAGCINDANAMHLIADGLGYRSTLLLDDKATSEAVIEAIGSAAQELAAGDHLLLTYSGHGSYVDDVNGDEEDAQDETWVLWDRMLVDDEIYQLWSQFAPGVRVFALSDSCHSGTVLRMRTYQQMPQLEVMRQPYRTRGGILRLRAMPEQVKNRVVRARPGLYRSAQWLAGPSESKSIGASVILISGCQDNQLSADGDGNGLFTATLLEKWGDGAFQGSHREFWRAIADDMPVSQSPNFDVVGKPDPDFEAMRPFVLEEAGVAVPVSGEAGGQGMVSPEPSGSTAPSVWGPESTDREAAAPVFGVDLAGAAYYVLEVATEGGLFSPSRESDRGESNWYATWSDANLSGLLTASSFQLPEEAWEQLREADRLYVRIGTTTADDGTWPDYLVSVGDEEGAQAWITEITGARVRPPVGKPPARRKAKTSPARRGAPARAGR